MAKRSRAPKLLSKKDAEHKKAVDAYDTLKQIDSEKAEEIISFMIVDLDNTRRGFKELKQRRVFPPLELSKSEHLAQRIAMLPAEKQEKVYKELAGKFEGAIKDRDKNKK